EIFDLGAPSRGEAEFAADAGRPAGGGMGFRQAESLAGQFTECQTAGAIEQHIVDRIADPAAHRSEPRIGELPRRKGIVSGARLQVTLDAEHPGTLTGLPVVTGLHAARKTRRAGRIVVDRAPGIAEIAAEIGAGPAIAVGGLVDGGERARSVGKSAACADAVQPAASNAIVPQAILRIITLPRNGRHLRPAGPDGYEIPLFPIG